MPKFSVTLEESVTYTVEVNADDEQQAREIAGEEWAQSSDPTTDFSGQGAGVDVIGCELVSNQDEPELKTYIVTIGADVRCYCETDPIEAASPEEARKKALEMMDAAGAVLTRWSWKPEEVIGDVTMSAEDCDDPEPEAEFVRVPDWNDRDYQTVELHEKQCMAALRQIATYARAMNLNQSALRAVVLDTALKALGEESKTT